MILIDTSGLLAAIDATQRHHHEAVEVLARDDGPYILSPFVLAEVDHLLMTRVGVDAELDLLAEVGRGAYQLAAFGADDVATARDLIRTYADQAVGLADASIVVLAQAYGTRRVLTIDERHFRVLRTAEGEPFVVLPLDEPKVGA